MNQRSHVTIITGPTGGIGAVLCEQLAESGHSLLMLARDAHKLDTAICLLSQRFPKQTFKREIADIGDLSSIRSAVARLNLDGLKINGIVLMPPQVPPTDDCMPEPDEWETIHRRSFIGPLELLKGCIPLFDPTKRGKIVIVSGISSAQVLGHYATSNVLRLTWLAEAKTLAFALGPRNIHVNTVSFGGVLTQKYCDRMVTKAAARGVPLPEQMAEEVANVPLRKYASPREAAVVIEGLLGPFSDHLTGINLLCDGGFTRAY
jgi:3-oxoacyl-[acyl-carrier protein] reductase